ncbi:MAG: hypothetical protein RI897_2043 [Verrucomicrobiota bacterium]
MVAVGEDDGDLGDPEALAPDFMGHFDLEAVAVGVDPLEVEVFECGSAEAFEAPGGVGEGHSGDDLDVLGCPHAEQQSTEGPVDHAYAIAVTGAEYQVCCCGGFEEAGDIVGVVGEVAVHFEDELVILFKCPFESGAIGAAEAGFGGAVQDVDGGVRGGELVGELAGSIG